MGRDFRNSRKKPQVLFRTIVALIFFEPFPAWLELGWILAQ
jgi:hypothetical protein